MKKISINLVVLLFICIVALSCKPTIKPTKHFSCSLFELDYPTDWQVGEKNGSVPEQLVSLSVTIPLSSAPDAEMDMTVYVVSAVPDEGKTLDYFIAKNRQDFRIAPNDVLEEKDGELGGLKAHCLTAKIPFTKDKKIMVKELMLMKDKQFILVCYLANNSNYSKYENDFNSITASFKFK